MEKSIEPWINSILITSFDETKGPQIDYEYPELSLPESVKNEIKISSLPRTCSDTENQCFFVLRIRADKTVTYSMQLCDSHDFLYGYVYFQWAFVEWAYQQACWKFISPERIFSVFIYYFITFSFLFFISQVLVLCCVKSSLSVLMGSLYLEYHKRVVDLVIDAVSLWWAIFLSFDLGHIQRPVVYIRYLC